MGFVNDMPLLFAGLKRHVRDAHRIYGGNCIDWIVLIAKTIAW